jgi:hypothetical protein
MASATGIPESVPGVEADENEPLLGRVGDASQEDGKALWHNLVIGTFRALNPVFPILMANPEPIQANPSSSIANIMYRHRRYCSSWNMGSCCCCVECCLLTSFDSVLGTSCE